MKKKQNKNKKRKKQKNLEQATNKKDHNKESKPIKFEKDRKIILTAVSGEGLY